MVQEEIMTACEGEAGNGEEGSRQRKPWIAGPCTPLLMILGFKWQSVLDFIEVSGYQLVIDRKSVV